MIFPKFPLKFEKSSLELPKNLTFLDKQLQEQETKEDNEEGNFTLKNEEEDDDDEFEKNLEKIDESNDAPLVEPEKDEGIALDDLGKSKDGEPVSESDEDGDEDSSDEYKISKKKIQRGRKRNYETSSDSEREKPKKKRNRSGL